MTKISAIGYNSPIYRVTFAYEEAPYIMVQDPQWPNNSWRTIKQITGPEETIYVQKGMFTTKPSIKAYVTKHRGYQKNFRVVKIEVVDTWREDTL